MHMQPRQGKGGGTRAPNRFLPLPGSGGSLRSVLEEAPTPLTWGVGESAILNSLGGCSLPTSTGVPGHPSPSPAVPLPSSVVGVGCVAGGGGRLLRNWLRRAVGLPISPPGALALAAFAILLVGSIPTTPRQRQTGSQAQGGGGAAAFFWLSWGQENANP